MQTVIIVIHLMVVLGLIGLVMLQKSEGGGLGMGGGGGGFLTSRGTSNMLTRSTAILAAVFFVTSLLLSMLAGMSHRPTSIFNTTTSGPAAPLSAPAQPKAPAAGGGTATPAAPAAPAKPAAPAQPQAPNSH
jgi:preprotein translocase subunit SecG